MRPRAGTGRDGAGRGGPGRGRGTRPRRLPAPPGSHRRREWGARPRRRRPPPSPGPAPAAAPPIPATRPASAPPPPAASCRPKGDGAPWRPAAALPPLFPSVAPPTGRTPSPHRRAPRRERGGPGGSGRRSPIPLFCSHRGSWTEQAAPHRGGPSAPPPPPPNMAAPTSGSEHSVHTSQRGGIFSLLPSPSTLTVCRASLQGPRRDGYLAAGEQQAALPRSGDTRVPSPQHPSATSPVTGPKLLPPRPPAPRVMPTSLWQHGTSTLRSREQFTPAASERTPPEGDSPHPSHRTHRAKPALLALPRARHPP